VRLIGGLLFGVQPTDPVSFAIATAVFVVVVLEPLCRCRRIAPRTSTSLGSLKWNEPIVTVRERRPRCVNERKFNP
jgi:hypothetical protein